MSSNLTETSHTSTYRILVVEDDKVLRQLITELLAEVGAETESVASGDVAVEQFRQRQASAVHFDVALVDLGVPVVGGVKVLETLRRMDDNIRLVAMSGADADSEARALFSERHIHFIRKPFDFRTLVKILGVQ